MSEKYEKWLVVDFDGDGCVDFVIGAYHSIEEAKQEAEAYIIDLVENGDFENGCRKYNELTKTGAGIVSDWEETELEDGLCISYKYTADSGLSEMMIIPVPNGFTNPSVKSYTFADRVRIEMKASSIANLIDKNRCDGNNEEAQRVLKEVKREIADLLESIEDIEAKITDL